MSYYYEDTSHYSYTIPAHYEDTSNYSYSVPADYNLPSEPVYYDDTPSDPIYYDDFTSDPVYYDNTISDHIYDDNTRLEPTFDDDQFSPISPTSYELEYEPELEANHDAEAVAEAIYYEEDIHPAYLDPPADSDIVYGLAQPLPTLTTIDEPTSTVVDYDYLYDGYSDEKLIQRAENLEELLEEMRTWDAEDAENKALGRNAPGVNPPAQPYHESAEFKRLVQSAKYIEAIQKGRIEETMDNDDDIDEAEDGNHWLPPPILPSHHDFTNNTVSTRFVSTFLITANRRPEPRYYFGQPIHRRRQPRPHNLRNNTRTPPPDTRLPKPHPISPNIHTRLHRRSFANHHPPDILTPKPIPPKPNISIQPLTFRQPRRPRRKHPPHTVNQIHPLIPHHYHNVIRRILKKGHPVIPDVRGRTLLGGG
jgi:hypothetical protein